MNLYPGKMSAPVHRGHDRKQTASFRCYSGFVVKSTMLFLAFMMVLVAHLYLRQQSVKSAERTDDIKKQINEVRAETRNLRIHVAKLTDWKHISSKIREFKLDLVQAASGQIVRIAVYTPQQAASIPLTPLTVASANVVNSGNVR